jgi:hypothetical protein
LGEFGRSPVNIFFIISDPDTIVVMFSLKLKYGFVSMLSCEFKLLLVFSFIFTPSATPNTFISFAPAMNNFFYV